MKPPAGGEMRNLQGENVYVFLKKKAFVIGICQLEEKQSEYSHIIIQFLPDNSDLIITP